MKTEGFLGLGLAALILLAVLLYAQGYAEAIQNSTTVDAQTKMFVSFVPLLLSIGIFVLTALFIVMVALELRRSV
jgi:uncharacterized membrane protein YidH (DUF202 family)